MRKKIAMERVPRYEEIRCNRCGKSLTLYEGRPLEDFVTVDKTWGYFSSQDGVRVQFDLCEDCVRELMAGFALPPVMEDVSEFF